MKTIYKYKLEIIDQQTIELPQYAEILCVGVQQENIYLWALIDTEATLNEMRDFEVFGKGNPVYENKEPVVVGQMKTDRIYLGTCFVGVFVWHVFERIY